MTKIDRRGGGARGEKGGREVQKSFSRTDPYSVFMKNNIEILKKCANINTNILPPV